MRFRLWCLGAALMALCIWLAQRADDARAQRRCAEQIRSLGGTVYYDYVSSRGGMPAGVSPYPPWLVRCCGEDFLHRIVRVDLPRGVAIDTLELQSVELVTLHGNDIDDADVARIASLPRLKHLKTVSHGMPGRHRSTQVTDQSLARLGQMQDLESVAIESSKLTCAGVELLVQAPRLKSLRIHGITRDCLDTWQPPPGIRAELSWPAHRLITTGGPLEDQSYCVGGDAAIRSTTGQSIREILFSLD